MRFKTEKQRRAVMAQVNQGNLRVAPAPKRNTAFYRAKALDFEKKLDWQKAFECYDLAIKNYPAHHPDSELARADLSWLEKQKAQCLVMVQQKNKKLEV
ncbi:hypothetical protein KY346_05560 [Candidatus Woesearchaeota archaeon]|nr:hypothetical protein [Candidatus Woesearchaeota archaeon]MBW3002601.1 hypothetical protein [Candidatus Woesearchaeota archaeon]